MAGMVRIGIMGTGGIAHHFVKALEGMDGLRAAAVCSRSLGRAQAFAREIGGCGAFDDPAQMLALRPDLVYIASTNDRHAAQTRACLERDVPVLCEKAMFLSLSEARQVFSLSEERGVFCMEAMWSVFLPALRQARAWAEAGAAGRDLVCDLTLGFRAPEDPLGRYFSQALGGGAMYDLTVYGIEITNWMFGATETVSVRACPAPTGVDAEDFVTLRAIRSGTLVNIHTTFLEDVTESLVIRGSEGQIVVAHPHTATEAVLARHGERKVRFQDTVTRHGFQYEIEECLACLAAGRRESRTVPHALTLSCARVFDRLRESLEAGGRLLD